MILVVFRTVLLVQRPWTNLWKVRFINTNYYYYYYCATVVGPIGQRMGRSCTGLGSLSMKAMGPTCISYP